MKRLRAMALAIACTGCAQVAQVAPPVVPLATSYREAASAWVNTGAAAGLAPQSWWTAFDDPELDALQHQLLRNSPDLASALARYQQARAATDTLRAAQSPTVGANAALERSGQRQGSPQRAPGTNTGLSSATIGLELEYEIDLWGRVRQQVRAGLAQERGAQADFAAARLALQAQLADTLIALRGTDAELALLRDTVAAYTRAAELIERRHQLGVATGLDAARALAQAESARSQLRQMQAQRALLEHAIAALVGTDPSGFVIAPQVTAQDTPVTPVGVPSELLQRRPDLAAAQQRVAAAAESLGVARTAFFPSLTIGAAGGVQGSELARLVSLPNLFWAVGSALAVDVLDGGRRHAQVAQAQAVLDESGQRYRSAVLVAIQQVEDQLALLTHYGAAMQSEQMAANAAQRAVALATRRYEQGAGTYLEVVTAQAASLDARRSTTDLRTRHRRAAVQLVRALGGGWSPDQNAALATR
jgi:NodT family efflux transporter outer membrane factor (OMF) lipoprotein